jgi:hypothetical protein
MYQMKGEFCLYKLENNQLIISDVDIISYNKTSHEIRLTIEAVKKIEEIQTDLYGQFVIKINGNEVYKGTFVPPYVSRSYDSTEIIIVPIIEDNIIRIQMGYPATEVSGEDPRNNVSLFEHFDKTNKLTK